MNPRNKELAQKAYNDFATGKHDEFFNFFSEDVQWKTPRIEGSYFQGNLNGREEVRAFFSRLIEEAEYKKFEPLEYIADGNKVVVKGEAEVFIKDTRQTFETNWVHIYELRDESVVKFEEFYDSHQVARAFQKAASA